MMFTHFGCITNRWFPEKSHGTLTADDLIGTSIEALAPHVEKLLLTRGIRAMNEWTPTMHLGQGNDEYTQVSGSFFTCMPVTPNSDDPYSFDTATKFNAKPIGSSLDHVCARQLSPNGEPLYLRVSGSSENPQAAVSYSAGEEMYPGIGSLTQAYSLLTGLFQSGDPVSPDSYEVLKGQGVLDVIQDDLETLKRYDMSASDKDKLAAWEQLLHNPGVPDLKSALCNAETASSLELTQESLDAIAGGSQGLPNVASTLESGLTVADLFSNVAVLSALCNANPVVWLKYPAFYVFRELGIDTDNASLSHRVGNASIGGTCVADVTDQLETLDRFYAQSFAHLVATLDSIPEGDGTLLDNCAVNWLQQFSDGCAHNLNNLPVIQAGSCGGYFKTGQAINVWDESPDLSRGNSELCETSAALDFSDHRAFGTPEEIANAPINKYYCGLMNAIGVKAGPDGFPAEGGTEKVTHYGMYDRTEDFVGGGTVPPNISDPGEFEALKA
jgi:hypothetical protein